MFKTDKTPKYYSPAEALQKIAAFCAYQERHQKEVEQKLKSYGLDEDDIGEIIIRLSREKLLDEERFAQAFVRGHYRHKKWGRRRIMQELKFKGISEFCIKSGLKEIDGDEYYQNLQDVLAKKDRQEKETHPHKRRQKIMNYLTVKGYEQDLIKMALDDLAAEGEE